MHLPRDRCSGSVALRKVHQVKHLRVVSRLREAVALWQDDRLGIRTRLLPQDTSRSGDAADVTKSGRARGRLSHAPQISTRLPGYFYTHRGKERLYVCLLVSHICHSGKLLVVKRREKCGRSQKRQFRKEEERSERQMPRTEIMTEAQDRPLEVSQPKEYLTYLFFFFISTPLSYSPSQCTCFAPKGKDKPEV